MKKEDNEICVDIKLNIWQRIRFTTSQDPKKFIENLIKTDPACNNIENDSVDFLHNTEEPIKAEYYIVDDTFPYRTHNFLSIDIILAKLSMIVSEDKEDLNNTYIRLKKQSDIDGDVLADNVALIWEPLSNQLTVDEILDMIES